MGVGHHISNNELLPTLSNIYKLNHSQILDELYEKHSVILRSKGDDASPPIGHRQAGDQIIQGKCHSQANEDLLLNKKNALSFIFMHTHSYLSATLGQCFAFFCKEITTIFLAELVAISVPKTTNLQYEDQGQTLNFCLVLSCVRRVIHGNIFGLQCGTMLLQ